MSQLAVARITLDVLTRDELVAWRHLPRAGFRICPRCGTHGEYLRGHVPRGLICLTCFYLAGCKAPGRAVERAA